MGFIALLIGVESTQDATLLSMGKGVSIAQIRDRFAVLRQSTMVINAYFIVGNIGETAEQMLSTASFAREIGVRSLSTSPAPQRALLGPGRRGGGIAGLPHRWRWLRV